MSLVRIATRTVLVEALKGRTLVGDNVHDSKIGVLDIAGDGTIRTSEDKPFLAVYTDAAQATDIDIRSMKENGQTEILFEMGVTAAMTETNDDGVSLIVGVGVPATDRALEFLLDLLARQIADILTDPDNTWAEIYRGLVSRIVKIERARAGNVVDGQRLAGQQIKVIAELIEDPVKGEPLAVDTPFALFLAAIEASEDEDLRTQAALIRAQMTSTNADWQTVQRRLGLTGDEVSALGLVPLGPENAGEVTIEVDGRPGVVVDTNV
jgi:hypothetical protein